jgi:hypothetical protein
MLRLTDTQLHVLINAAVPIYPADRDGFLRDIALALDGRGEIGEGEFFRIIKAAQLKHHPRPGFDSETRGFSGKITRVAPYRSTLGGEPAQAISGAAGSEIASQPK